MAIRCETLYPRPSEASPEFTGKKGREITSWISETVEERIEFLIKHYGAQVCDHLEVALFAIYRDASEVLHGTAFGSIKGLTGPYANSALDSPDAFVRHRHAIFCELLFLVGSVLSALVQIAARQLSDASLEKRASELMTQQAPVLGIQTDEGDGGKVVQEQPPVDGE